MCPICKNFQKVGIYAKIDKVCKECKLKIKINNKPKKMNREEQKEYLKRIWEDKDKRKEASIKTSLSMKEKWKDEFYKNKVLLSLINNNKDKDMILKRTASFQELLATTDLRDKMCERSKKLWESESFRKLVLDGMMNVSVRQKMSEARLKQQNNPSKLELILNNILSDLKIKYEKQYKLAFYLFDFYIPRDNRRGLLIEVNGDYWHRSVPHVIKNDKSKNTYYDRYLKDKYELIYFWEHEFLCYNKIYDKIKYLLSINTINNFDFKNIKIDLICKEESEIFINSYHYLKFKNGIHIGAKLDDKLIAVAIYSNPVRIESATSLGIEYKNTLELSRFCISPEYNKKNLASFFLSKTYKFIPNNIKIIIAFSDLTIGHTGVIYKADNWQKVDEIPSDYWYIDNTNHYIHKRTLYSHAVNLKMKENEFAEKFNYTKIHGLNKIKFIKILH
jgi:hypothetical protein